MSSPRCSTLAIPRRDVHLKPSLIIQCSRAKIISFIFNSL